MLGLFSNDTLARVWERYVSVVIRGSVAALVWKYLTGFVKYHDKFLVNKTNRRTEFQIYWYCDSTCFGQPFRPSSGIRTRTSTLVHFMQFWWPFATRSRMELQFHPAPANKGSQLHKMYQSRCTAKNSWWWAQRLPEICRVVIPINLEFSASVGFIHKEFVTMHGHTNLKITLSIAISGSRFEPDSYEMWCRGV